jgi:hypothetical protein
MAMTDPASRASTPLLERIKGILVDPRAEWQRIAAEPETVASLYTGYIVPVAGFAVLCGFISHLMGFEILGVAYKPTYWQALTSAAWQYAVQLVGVFLVALIMGWVAPLFGGAGSRVATLKLAAYSATAGWLSNVFLLVPWLGFLAILGLYTLYLVYTGAPVLLGVPQNKALPFTAFLVAISIIVAILFSLLGSMVSSGGGEDYAAAQRHAAAIERQLGDARSDASASGNAAATSEPRAATAVAEDQAQAAPEDEAPSSGALGALAALTKRLEKLSGGADGLPPITTEALKELLPQDLPGGFVRTETSFSETGVAGMNMATATGIYASGDKQITLTLSDMGPAGAIAGLAGAFGASTSEESNGVIRKMSTVDSRMTTEEFDANQNSGMYGVMAADRVIVKAEGRGITDIGDLKDAVASVDMIRVEALAGK